MEAAEIDRNQNIIVLDVGGTNIRAAIVGGDYQIMHKTRQKTVTTDADSLVQQILTLIQTLKQQSSGIVGIGIAVAGPVDHENGILIQAPNLAFPQRFPLMDYLDGRLGFPVLLIESEIKMAAVGELYFGVAKGKQNVVVLTIGTGLGAGVIINGQLYHGAHFLAGETGHTAVRVGTDAHKCGCGRRGCIETYSAGPSLTRRMKAISGRRLSPKAILEMASNGDPQAVSALMETAVYIGVCIANLEMYYDPELVVLRGGFISNIWHAIQAEIEQTVAEHSMASETPILLSELGDDGSLYGLAVVMTYPIPEL